MLSLMYIFLRPPPAPPKTILKLFAVFRFGVRSHTWGELHIENKTTKNNPSLLILQKTLLSLPPQTISLPSPPNYTQAKAPKAQKAKAVVTVRAAKEETSATRRAALVAFTAAAVSAARSASAITIPSQASGGAP